MALVGVSRLLDSSGQLTDPGGITADNASGANFGILTTDNLVSVVLCDGNRLWVSTNRGLAFSQQTLPGGVADTAGIRLGLGYSAQFLGVLIVSGAGQAGYDAASRKMSGRTYYPITRVHGTTVEFGAARTSPNEVGLSHLVQLDWPGEGTGGVDRLVGVGLTSRYHVLNAAPADGSPTLVYRAEAEAAGLPDVAGPWWTGSAGIGAGVNIAAVRGFSVPGGWSVDIEHDGSVASHGARPLNRQFHMWYCGPPVADTGGLPTSGVTVARVNPHATPPEVVSTVWTLPTQTVLYTGGVPTAGIWDGGGFLVARYIGAPAANGGSGRFAVRRYTSPSSYTALPLTPDWPETASGPVQVRMYAHANGIGLIGLRPTLDGIRPKVYDIRFDRDVTVPGGGYRGAWEDQWTNIVPDTSPSWGSNQPAPVLNVDRFPEWGGHAQVMELTSGNVHYFQRNVGVSPTVTWQPASLAHDLEPVNQTLTLSFLYYSPTGRGMGAWALWRNIGGQRAWWRQSDSTWQPSLYRNPGGTTSGAVFTVTLPVSWARAANAQGLYDPVEFSLFADDSSHITDPGGGVRRSPTISLTVRPTVTVGQVTITAPSGSPTFTTRPTVDFAFPTSNRPFDSVRFAGVGAFAAEYEVQVLRRGTEIAQYASGWTSQVYASSAASYAVSHQLPAMPNGQYTARVRWRVYGAPYNLSSWETADFTLNLAAPEPPALSFQVIDEDGVRAAITGGLATRRNVAVSVVCTGTGGAGQSISSVEIQRREQTRADHRPLNPNPKTVGFIDPYLTVGVNRFNDYTCAAGVEYQYRAIATGAEGSQATGGWAPA